MTVDDVRGQRGRIVRFALPLVAAVAGGLISYMIARAELTVGPTNRRPDSAIGAMSFGALGALSSLVFAVLAIRIYRRKTP